MRILTALILFAAVLATDASAGRAGSSGSTAGRSSVMARSNSTGASTSPRYAAATRSAAPDNRTTFRPAASAVPRFGAGSNRLGTRRSLLPERGGPSPSPTLAQEIRAKESSGPGWLGTAFLVSLLSRHDLSGSDRQWIESKIASLRDSGNDDEVPQLAPAIPNGIRFEYEGLQAAYPVGKPIRIEVRARDAAGTLLAVACQMEDGQARVSGTSAAIQWLPAAPAVRMLTCRAGGQRDRRIVKAA